MRVMDVSAESGAMETYMRRALALAHNAWADTYPNPMVGAVLVNNEGVIVGEGWHERAGGPHAEINALRKAGEKARGASMYVTLEPCCTYGRTPPCTKAIIEAGVSRVIVGATDPNPAHAGKGFVVLREAGIEVISGVLEEECDDLNLIFNHWMGKGTALFAAKIATTLDGRIAARSGDSKWITGEAARENVHIWRRYFPAIAVGAGTVLKDDPSLSVRLHGREEECPRRFVFDRTLRSVISPLPKLYSDKFCKNTSVVTCAGSSSKARALLEEQGVGLVELAAGDGFLPAFREYCVEQGIHGVLVEGGRELLSSMFRAKMLDYLFCYRAPILLADVEAFAAFEGAAPQKIADSIRLRKVRHELFGDDVLTRGWI